MQYSSNFLEKCQARNNSETEAGEEAKEDTKVEVVVDKDEDKVEKEEDEKGGEVPDLLADVKEHKEEEGKDDVEDLLENEDSCVFQEDRLTLEINTNSVDSSPCHATVADKETAGGDSNVDATDSTATSKPPPNKQLSRSDSRQSTTSQGSISSVASDLGQASVKAMTGIKSKISGLWPVNAVGGVATTGESSSLSAQAVTSDAKGPTVEMTDMRPPSPNSLVSDALGFPLPVFTKGVLCHPYLSLQHYDLLRDANVRGFLVGASNMLFKQKRHLLDVIIEVN